jgi:ketosteroid isomerase-like protein
VSADNLEIVRRFLELGLTKRDFNGAFQLVQPDAEFDWSNSLAPYSGVYRGADQGREAWSAWLEAWERWDIDIVEAIELDAETLVVVTRVRAKGKGSGVTVDAGGAALWRVRDGKISYAKLFQSKDEALAAVSPPAT